MKRRLMIARAMMHEPKLLILDEPTAGVDIELRRSMWDFLNEMNNNGTSIILTTHYLEEAEMLCRRIAIIDRGVIKEDTTMKNFLNQLNEESFIFDLAAPIEPLNIEIIGVKFNLVDPMTLEVTLDKAHSMNDLFQLLESQNIQVRSMRNKSNRLEELFVKMVEKKSGWSCTMNINQLGVALYTIVHKEVRRFMRIWPQTLLPPAITMSLYFVIFGNLVGSRIGQMGGYSYMEFIVPGLIMMAVITNSYANVSSNFFSSKFQKSIEELIMSPVPLHAILWGYVLGGVIRGLFVAIIVSAMSLFLQTFILPTGL